MKKLDKNTEFTNVIIRIRQAVADYMKSEGCSCCRDVKAHKIHKRRLAKLLNVEPYSDNSGYDFTKYRSNEGLKSKRKDHYDK